MAQTYSIWHITPADIGVEFFNPTSSALEANENLYRSVHGHIDRFTLNSYSKEDQSRIKFMQNFFSDFNRMLAQEKDYLGEKVTLEKNFPSVCGCIAKYNIGAQLHCYIMISGMAVFMEEGEPCDIDGDDYFSIRAFYDRQVYEDDYCNNPEESDRKRVVYRFLDLLRKVGKNKERVFSSSRAYHCHGIPYTLCITLVDIPELDASIIDEKWKKNIYALLETSAFNNVLDRSQWDLIRKRIDSDPAEEIPIKRMSESLVIGDSWSGVVVAGNLRKNRTCLMWLMEFELYLQSQWVLFDAYNECIARQDYSALELQSIINNVEYIKIQLDNDISTNMEQSRMQMRKSLVETSDIGTIYSRMRGILDNKLKLKMLSDEKRRNKYSMMSDVALLIIALMQIYGVIKQFLSGDLGRTDYMTIGIMLVIATVCITVLVEGKK